MQQRFPTFQYTEQDAQVELARFVRIDNPESYPFDQHHAHAYNEVMVFLKGGGTHTIDFKSHTIADESIHLLAKGSLHWLERGMQSNGFAIVYQEQYLWKMNQMNPAIDYIHLFNTSAVINLNKTSSKDFQFIFQEMLSNQTPSAYQLNLIAAFLTKVALLLQTQPLANIPKPTASLHKLIELVNKHYLDHYTLSDYAKLLHISDKQLSSLIKKNTGKTLFLLIQDRKLLEAKKLLIQSDDQVAEIAYKLNFNEPAHFSNWFKKCTGLTPQQFRSI